MSAGASIPRNLRDLIDRVYVGFRAESADRTADLREHQLVLHSVDVPEPWSN